MRHIQRYQERNFRKNNVALCLLIAIFLLAKDTWLFKGGVLAKQIEIAIRVFVPILLIVLFKKHVIPRKGRFILVVYGILIFYMLIMAIFSENFDLVILNIAKYIYILTFLVAFLMVLHPDNFSYRFLYIVPYLGLFFSIQTILLFLLMQTGHTPLSSIVTLVGYKNMNVLSYGIFGYAHGSGIGDLGVYRAQSFFGEPTTLAAFLEVATILSFGLYKIRKNRKMLTISVLCAISLLLTFSMTTYVVVFLTFCFYKMTLNWKKMGSLMPVVVVVTTFLAVIVILFYFYVATHGNFYAQSKWGMAFGHSPMEVIHRAKSVTDSLRFFWHYPLGIGLIAIEDSAILENYPKAGGVCAPFAWMVIAGIVGITAQLTIMFCLFKNIIIKYIRMAGRIERYIALSFVIYILHHCVAGNWFSAMFFFLFACLITMDAYQFSFDDDPKYCNISRDSGWHVRCHVSRQ